jgi:hypothetical protein
VKQQAVLNDKSKVNSERLVAARPRPTSPPGFVIDDQEQPEQPVRGPDMVSDGLSRREQPGALELHLTEVQFTNS